MKDNYFIVLHGDFQWRFNVSELTETFIFIYP